jgi:hypothetical protein
MIAPTSFASELLIKRLNGKSTTRNKNNDINLRKYFGFMAEGCSSEQKEI